MSHLFFSFFFFGVSIYSFFGVKGLRGALRKLDMGGGGVGGIKDIFIFVFEKSTED